MDSLGQEAGQMLEECSTPQGPVGSQLTREGSAPGSNWVTQQSGNIKGMVQLSPP